MSFRELLPSNSLGSRLPSSPRANFARLLSAAVFTISSLLASLLSLRIQLYHPRFHFHPYPHTVNLAARLIPCIRPCLPQSIRGSARPITHWLPPRLRADIVILGISQFAFSSHLHHLLIEFSRVYSLIFVFFFSLFFPLRFPPFTPPQCPGSKRKPQGPACSDLMAWSPTHHP